MCIGLLFHLVMLVPETWMQIGIPRVVGCQVLTLAIDATIVELLQHLQPQHHAKEEKGQKLVLLLINSVCGHGRCC